MAKKESKNKTYYEKYHKLLSEQVKKYKESILTLFSTNDYSVFRSIEQGITKHPLRHYQLDALYTMDHLIRAGEDKPEKSELMEIVDSETNKKAPFLGYEMATGSGKTMLMGASIYFINKKYNIKNFLIITPASTDIYYKTIRNFEIGNFESVWADDTPFTFNLITGDNYSQNLFFDHNKDANIFIFNISKFGTNATNTTLTWETAIWKDDNGNSISIKQFLKDKKLVIITDEAHHAQTMTANKIINSFHPDIVLEFTATAVEKEKNEDKKNQTIVYKYDIKQFLEDGHGKLVRAVALAPEDKPSKDDINTKEKQKLITLIMIHLLKKKSVLLDSKTKGIKPIAFIKVKDDTIFTEKVFKYIKDGLVNDTDNINIILEKIKAPDLEITKLLSEMYKNEYQSNIKLLKQDITNSVNTSIFYYGKSDKETEKKFENIRKNEVEIVVYMQRLDEGIDLPNIYSMAVINDTSTDFKTAVKQIIGRGVRLGKNKREFDDETNILKANAEKLHIVCDQGKNFEEVIEAIQQEFGLNDKYLSFDKEKKKITNSVKGELLKGKYIPHIRAEFKVKPETELISLVKDINTIVDNFIENNCFDKENDNKVYLKYRPENFFLEVDVFSDKKIYHEQLLNRGGRATKLILSEKEVKAILGIVQKQLYCLPNMIEIETCFFEYINKFNERGLYFYSLDIADEKLAKNLFINTFSFFYRSHIEKNYYKLDFRELKEADSWSLATHFKDYDIKIPVDQEKNKMRIKYKTDKEKIKNLINSQYHLYGYEKSAYDYDKFDSYTEYQLAEFVNDVLNAQKRL